MITPKEQLRDTRLVGFDVDGVFTDGRFYLSDEGVETKAFSTQDGYGIRQLIKAGIHVAIISGRKSRAVELRMKELGVEHVFLGSPDKMAVFDRLTESLGVSPEQSVYVGDDIPDLPLLTKVGYPVAVANAVRAIREYCDYTTELPGGNGAVREVCELVLASRDAAK